MTTDGTELTGIPLDAEPSEVVLPDPPAARAFHTGQVLTITVGDAEAGQQFCSYADTLAILSFLLGYVPLADDLPDAIEHCRPHVLEQVPGLDALRPPAVGATDVMVLSWIAGVERDLGDSFELTPLPPEDVD